MDGVERLTGGQGCRMVVMVMVMGGGGGRLVGVGVEVDVDGRRSRSNGGAGQRDEGGDSEWREREHPGVCAELYVLYCAALAKQYCTWLSR
jgi:hypothetical protein